MKLWIRKTLMGVFGASIALGGLTACSSGFTHRMSTSAEKMAEMRGKLVERVGKKLELDDVQKQKLDVLSGALDAQRDALRGTAANPSDEMLAIVASTKFDRARAQALVEEKTKAIQANSPEVIGALADFYDSLRPPQQQKVREMMQHRRSGWMARG